MFITALTTVLLCGDLYYSVTIIYFSALLQYRYMKATWHVLTVQEKPKVLQFTGGIFYGFCIVSLVPVLNDLRHVKPGVLVRHSFLLLF